MYIYPYFYMYLWNVFQLWFPRVTSRKHWEKDCCSGTGRVGNAGLSRVCGSGKCTEIWLRVRVFPFFPDPNQAGMHACMHNMYWTQPHTSGDGKHTLDHTSTVHHVCAYMSIHVQHVIVYMCTYMYVAIYIHPYIHTYLQSTHMLPEDKYTYIHTRTHFIPDYMCQTIYTTDPCV